MDDQDRDETAQEWQLIGCGPVLVVPPGFFDCP
jgi:hypothetical protein